MTERPRHPDKDLEAILVAIEGLKWRVERRGKYFWCRCPCGAHQTHVHLTPSNPRHGRERLAWCKRQDCKRRMGHD